MFWEHLPYRYLPKGTPNFPLKSGGWLIKISLHSAGNTLPPKKPPESLAACLLRQHLVVHPMCLKARWMTGLGGPADNSKIQQMRITFTNQM